MAERPVGFDVENLREFAKRVRQIDRTAPKAMRAAHREVAAELLSRVQDAAPPELQRSLRSKGTTKTVALTVGLRPARAIAEFMGADRRTGWYAAPRYRSSSGRQFRPWVGNQWVPGEADRHGAPYYIGPPLNRAMPEIEALYLRLMAGVLDGALESRAAIEREIDRAVARGLSGTR